MQSELCALLCLLLLCLALSANAVPFFSYGRDVSLLNINSYSLVSCIFIVFNNLFVKDTYQKVTVSMLDTVGRSFFLQFISKEDYFQRLGYGIR